MDNSFACEYEVHDKTFDFIELIQEFKSRGMSLEHPRMGVVIGRSEEGDEFHTSGSEISRRIGPGKTVNFQWWLGEDGDVVCSIAVVGAYVEQYYSLDATDWKEKGMLIHALLDRFARLCKEGLAEMLVVDLRKYPAEIEWDSFVRGQGQITCLEDLPDLLILRSKDLSRIKCDLSGRSRSFCEGYQLITRDITPRPELRTILDSSCDTNARSNE